MNLYVHFPFCRRKCRYCALPSRAGSSSPERDAYVRRLASVVAGQAAGVADGLLPPEALRVSSLDTVYFGGGTPALCDLDPLLDALAPFVSPETEFTVELHPLDVTDELLSRLRDGGVNRISMGVQSLDDATLAAMGRGCSSAEAARAFARVRRFFDNAGVDLIVGYPGDPCADFSPLADWGLRHCSVYSLQNERGLKGVPDDDWTLDRVREAGAALGAFGLERYEISNYAAPGFECRHNLAVWRGEDYLGLGAGACGRVGRFRTRGLGAPPPARPEVEEVSPERDAAERRLFRLRTRDGLRAGEFPAEWTDALEENRGHGLLTLDGGAYRLTPRGAEVCDSILADLLAREPSRDEAVVPIAATSSARRNAASSVSVVIVTWKGDALLRDCLASLAAVYGDGPEIVVVDNANEASTRALVGRFPNAAYVATDRNLGFAGGNNVGLRRCTRDLVLLLNNDTVFRGDSLSPLVDFLARHPKAGVVQGTMNVPSLGNGLDDCGTVMTPLGIQRHLHRGEPTATTALKPRRVTAAKGAMMLFRRAVVADTGFLFYDDFGSFFEETDFCRRAANCGWETWFVPTPPIDHLCGATATRFDRDAVWTQYFRNILYSFARNWGWWGRLVMLPAFACAAFAKSPRNLLRALKREREGEGTPK